MRTKLLVAACMVIAGIGWAQVNGQGVISVNGALQSGGSGVTDHALLTHLDFASAGHTGFAPLANATLTGNTTMTTLRLFDGGTHYSIFQAQTQAADLTYTLPAAHGTGYLYDNGAGALVWSTPPGTGATTTLNNIGSVALSASLIPGSNNAIDAGSTSKRFAGGYYYTMEALTNVSSPALRITGGPYHSIFQGQTQAGDLAYTLPAAHAAGQLTNDGNGALSWASGGGGANTALSNLAATAVNVDLVPSGPSALNLGAADKSWAELWADSVSTNGIFAYPDTPAGLNAGNPTAMADAVAGLEVDLNASNAIAGLTNVGAAAGGSIVLQAGSAARNTSGDANGGDVTLTPGAGIGSGVSGSIKIPGGIGAAPAIIFGATTADGLSTDQNAGNHDLYFGGSGGYTALKFGTAGYELWTYNSGLDLGSAFHITWGPSATHGSRDVGIKRNGIGEVKVSDGLTGNGNVIASTAITAVGTAAANGYIRTGIYKRAWTNAEVVALDTGGLLTVNLKVATLPAKTIVRNAYVVIGTQAAGVTTLMVSLGRVATAYIDYIVASNAEVAANTVYGDDTVERGGGLTGYDMPSYTSTADVYLQFVATDAAKHIADVTTCSGTLYILTETLP